jgi:hypothetical protein
MSTTTPAPLPAWEPLTPRGVAGFARARWWRLLLAQVVVALAAAGIMGWFLEEEWFPVVHSAIWQLPEQGEIRGQQLTWTNGAMNLAGNHFLGFGVDPEHSGQLARTAQVQLEFGRRDAEIILATGTWTLEYPAGWRIAFNRAEVGAWWGAWEPALFAGATAGMFVGLLISWMVLATLYFVPVKLIALYEDRELRWGQSWRLAGAALLPGALFLIFGMLIYVLSSMALAQLGVVWVLHFVVGWIYLFVSPFFLPRAVTAAPKGDPFKRDK